MSYNAYSPASAYGPGSGAGAVDCGGHFATSCQACPQGNGAAWCNGDCAWVSGFFGGECAQSSFLPGLPEPDIVDWFSGDWISMSVWWTSLFSFSAFIMLLYACVFKTSVVDEMHKTSEYPNIAGKKLNLFACFAHPQTLIHTIFCMPVVMGKNYNAARTLGFWPGCLLSFCFLNSPLCLIGVCFRTFLAKQVQDNLGHESNYFKIFLANLFCMPCDVGRESLEVDKEVGAEITCCCNIYQHSRIISELDDARSRVCDNSFGVNRCCSKY